MPAAYRSKTLIQASFWLAAVGVGVASVLFDKLFHFTQQLYHSQLANNPIEIAIAAPIILIVSAFLVARFAPHAKGSGIPQALRATAMSVGSHQVAIRSGLISMKTALVKCISATLGILAGASIGREGPTVQISTAIFAWLGSRTKKIFPHADFHSYLVAGSAAGVAAAFNTPLAGISFALEEIAEGGFVQIKQTVMVSVIIAGIAAQTLVGNYVYFGKPAILDPGFEIVLPAIVIGILCGGLGGGFARALAHPAPFLKKIKWWQRAAVCGILIAGINYLTDGESAGTGYEITKDFMESEGGHLAWTFSIAKLFSTVFSYLSGIAGGIFSPSLAIGAGFGFSIADLLNFGDLKICALLGMVAFFTGVVQAPLTAVIIVMEMTELHSVIIPLMIAAFVAQGTSKLIMPTSLYRLLAQRKEY